MVVPPLAKTVVGKIWGATPTADKGWVTGALIPSPAAALESQLEPLQKCSAVVRRDAVEDD